MSDPIFLGIDIGTSGIRASCINSDEQELVSHHISFAPQLAVQGKNEQDPANWLNLLDDLLVEVSKQLSQLDSQFRITAIAIDGTSSTLIACKKDGTALSPALMYNDQQSQQQAQDIRCFAPDDSAVHGASSSLAKALLLLEKYPETELFCHQADWLSASLTGVFGISDENNCLKLGYDSIKQQWPDWLQNPAWPQNKGKNICLPKKLLPQVVAPGSFIGKVKTAAIEKYQLAENCIMVAGTTDSIAGVLATGAKNTGDAVTSLGSTLVIKLFSDKAIFNPEFGIYSHRIKDHWLVGGASNSGGAVLLQHFTSAQMAQMTPQLNPEKPTGLDYYPLPDTGERFPVNDSNKQSRIQPRPESDTDFFQALLEGISNIEAEAYKKLETLGATAPKRIFSTGGGSKNPAWKKIRERTLGLSLQTSEKDEACYGSALLAKQGFLSSYKL
jgi:sugar (pentulose or hexulose) kinase